MTWNRERESRLAPGNNDGQGLPLASHPRPWRRRGFGGGRFARNPAELPGTGRTTWMCPRRFGSHRMRATQKIGPAGLAPVASVKLGVGRSQRHPRISTELGGPPRQRTWRLPEGQPPRSGPYENRPRRGTCFRIRRTSTTVCPNSQTPPLTERVAQDSGCCCFRKKFASTIRLR